MASKAFSFFNTLCFEGSNRTFIQKKWPYITFQSFSSFRFYRLFLWPFISKQFLQIMFSSFSLRLLPFLSSDGAFVFMLTPVDALFHRLSALLILFESCGILYLWFSPLVQGFRLFSPVCCAAFIFLNLAHVSSISSSLVLLLWFGHVFQF